MIRKEKNVRQLLFYGLNFLDAVVGKMIAKRKG